MQHGLSPPAYLACRGCVRVITRSTQIETGGDRSFDTHGAGYVGLRVDGDTLNSNNCQWRMFVFRVMSFSGCLV